MGYQWFNKLATSWMQDRPGSRWDEVKRMVKQPLRGYDKESMPLWAFYKIRPDAERRIDMVRGNGLSVSHALAFIVDYDDGTISPWELHERMKTFTHAIYTTPGHTLDKVKFRMILPLAAPLTNSLLLYEGARKYFAAMFPGCDQTTFDAFRRQRAPHIPLDSKTAYEYYINDARLFVIDESLVPIAQEQAEVDTSTMFEFEIVKMREGLMLKYAAELATLDWTTRGGGMLHYALKRMAYALVQNGLSPASTRAFLLNNSAPMMRKEINQLVAWASGKRGQHE